MVVKKSKIFENIFSEKNDNNDKLVFNHYYDILFDASKYHMDKSEDVNHIHNRWFVNFTNNENYILSVHKLNEFMFANKADWIILSAKNYEIIEYTKSIINYYPGIKSLKDLNNDQIKNANELISGKAKTVFRPNEHSLDDINMTCLSSGFLEKNELVNKKLVLFKRSFIFPNIESVNDLKLQYSLFLGYINSDEFSVNSEKETYLKTMLDFFIEKSKLLIQKEYEYKFNNLKNNIFADIVIKQNHFMIEK